MGGMGVAYPDPLVVALTLSHFVCFLTKIQLGDSIQISLEGLRPVRFGYNQCLPLRGKAQGYSIS